jgi:hypothetical protein
VAELAGTSEVTEPAGTSEEPTGTAELREEPVTALTVDEVGWMLMVEGTAVMMAGLEGMALAQIPTM